MASKKDRIVSGNEAIFQEKSKLRGSLKFKKPLFIYGEYEGDISGTNTLEVGSSAQINANIEATSVIVFGKIKGNVVASDRVELRKGAQVIGNIKTPNIEIDDGVIFEGQCEMQKQPKSN